MKRKEIALDGFANSCNQEQANGIARYMNHIGAEVHVKNGSVYEVMAFDTFYRSTMFAPMRRALLGSLDDAQRDYEQIVIGSRILNDDMVSKVDIARQEISALKNTIEVLEQEIEKYQQLLTPHSKVMTPDVVDAEGDMLTEEAASDLISGIVIKPIDRESRTTYGFRAIAFEPEEDDSDDAQPRLRGE